MILKFGPWVEGGYMCSTHELSTADGHVSYVLVLLMKTQADKRTCRVDPVLSSHS